jgi:hypothetical protein
MGGGCLSPILNRFLTTSLLQDPVAAFGLEPAGEC